MTAIIDLFIDANILLILAFCLWRVMQFALQRSALRDDYSLQARLLKSVLLITLASPVLGLIVTSLGSLIAPDTPTTLSDIAVAAYLQGSISMPAVQFEALLNARGAATEAVLGSQSLWVLAPLVAFGGIGAALAARLALSGWRVHRTLEQSYLWHRTARVDIRLSDTISMPFAARGLWRRHVVLPTSLLTQTKDLHLVLAHEFQHLRSGDVEWELALEALRPVMFWNPAFVLWKRAFDQLRELSCDQRVIARHRVCPHDYAACLLAFCERRAAGPWTQIMNVALVSGAARSPRTAPAQPWSIAFSRSMPCGAWGVRGGYSAHWFCVWR